MSWISEEKGLKIMWPTFVFPSHYSPEGSFERPLTDSVLPLQCG